MPITRLKDAYKTFKVRARVISVEAIKMHWERIKNGKGIVIIHGLIPYYYLDAKITIRSDRIDVVLTDNTLSGHVHEALVEDQQRLWYIPDVEVKTTWKT